MLLKKKTLHLTSYFLLLLSSFGLMPTANILLVLLKKETTQINTIVTNEAHFSILIKIILNCM